MSKVKKCVGKESFLRMNYLYQLANLSVEIGQPSNFYGDLLLAISKRTVQKIEPAIKRNVCKKCHGILVPGKTSRVRIKKKRVVNVCLLCEEKKTFTLNEGHELWVEKDEALVELLDYNKF